MWIKFRRQSGYIRHPEARSALECVAIGVTGTMFWKEKKAWERLSGYEPSFLGGRGD